MATISEYPLHNTGQQVQTAIDDALDKLPFQITQKANTSEVLTKTNTTPYTPTEDYHPATKQYVDGIKPTVDIGETKTGEPGTDAKVENKGTPKNPVLDFTIPKGETGDAAGFAEPSATAETLEPTQSATASVTATGEDTAKKFDFKFGIPKGIQGDKGDQGFYVNKITKTDGTGAAGSTDTYTLYLNDDSSTPIGTIEVYNGTDGVGAGTVTSVGIANDDDSLTITDSPITTNGEINIKHKNSVEAQTTLGFYPIKIDKTGHISEYGESTRVGDMFKETYDIDDNGIVDGAESLHDEATQVWFSVD